MLRKRGVEKQSTLLIIIYSAHLLLSLGTDQIEPDGLVVKVDVGLFVHFCVLPAHLFTGQNVVGDRVALQLEGSLANLRRVVSEASVLVLEIARAKSGAEPV